MATFPASKRQRLPRNSEHPTHATKQSLLDDSDSDGGVETTALKVNEQYAKRFDVNKRRAELHRLEEKYGDEDEATESDSDDETEDDDAVLATEDIDAQISDALKAIKGRDPRIYDKSFVFVKLPEGGDEAVDSPKPKKEKPIRLQDYHRENLLRGDVDALSGEVSGGEEPRTYVQEQSALKTQLIADINANLRSESDEDDDFIKRKSTTRSSSNGRQPTVAITEEDVANADKDPELYLSNFMAARAWLPHDGSNWKAFDSDEEDDSVDEDAEEWEHMYNRRFEDPSKTNEVLTTFARDIAKKRSVRREKVNARQRQRDKEKEKKAAEKAARDEDRARLRRLKIEEAEWRLARIREVAGSKSKELKDEAWLKFLDEEWDNTKWEGEMERRFGEEYYAQEDAGSEEEDGVGTSSGKTPKKPKKPKWEDDIDIKDIVPDFEDDDAPPQITLTDDEDDGDVFEGFDDDQDQDDTRPAKKAKTSRDHKQERIAKKKAAKQERSKIEALVDAKMDLDEPALLAKVRASSNKKKDQQQGLFRYRETSPNSFGLTARDILLAPSDAALNEYAGLKKLASFRDADKKRQDRKRYGRGHHLRMWRKEIFGPEFEKTGPTYGFEKLLGGDEGVVGGTEGRTKEQKAKNQNGDDGEGAKKKRKRSKGKKKEGVAETVVS